MGVCSLVVSSGGVLLGSRFRDGVQNLDIPGHDRGTAGVRMPCSVSGSVRTVLVLFRGGGVRCCKKEVIFRPPPLPLFLSPVDVRAFEGVKGSFVWVSSTVSWRGKERD